MVIGVHNLVCHSTKHFNFFLLICFVSPSEKFAAWYAVVYKCLVVASTIKGGSGVIQTVPLKPALIEVFNLSTAWWAGKIKLRSITIKSSVEKVRRCCHVEVEVEFDPLDVSSCVVESLNIVCTA